MGDKNERMDFSRPIDVGALGDEPFESVIGADDEERAALAERLELVSLERLTASVRFARLAKRGLFRLSGRLSVDVVQSCVVTLEPVTSHIEEDFERLYSEHQLQPSDGLDVELTLESGEPPEVIEGGVVDAGEALAEQLALALDPYPRLPDSSIKALGHARAADENGDADGEPVSPFEILAKLKRGDRRG